ncbi:MAG: hypothetical protein KAR84_01690 [Elusimicrobiales bacterium]|nr:hypothetical protein [Elusimicrobiales bacterium]
MPINFQIIIFALVLLFTSCHNSEKKDQLHVFLNSLPEQVSTKKTSEGAGYYIIKQTHEPLFRRGDGQYYTSKILKSWNRNTEYTRFTFCPDTSKCFNKSHFFTLDFFKEYINETTKRYNKNFTLNRRGECFDIKFDKSNAGYLSFLAQYGSAPTIKKNKNMEEGLGHFSVAEISNNKILLKRKKSIRNGYNSIVFYESSSWDKSKFQNKESVDFNAIGSHDYPLWLKQSENHISFENIQLQSLILLINHPDKEIRKTLYNCMDVEKLRQAFFPGRKQFFDIKTILPVGIRGGKSGRPMQTCSVLRKNHKTEKPIVFLNYKENNKKQLENFAEDFLKKTGIKIKIIQVTQKEFFKALNSSRKPYNLMIVKFGAVFSEYASFFYFFINKYGYYNYSSLEMLPLYKKLFKANTEDKATIALQMLDEIKKEFLALPLYQGIKTFYYPKKIKNLEVGKGFSEYTEVADLRW